MTLVDRTVRWKRVAVDGAEVVRVRADAVSVLAESVVTASAEDRPFTLRYSVRCDAAWRVREARLAIDDARELRLLADDAGGWRSGEGTLLDALSGCIDIDITATPFTNTLPIRRLALAEGESRVVRVVYIRVPELTIELEQQRYTCLRRQALYRYENQSRSFSAELAVDEDGLVLDYPGLFERILI